MGNYEIWHDEYRGDDTENEYWHGIFFLPVNKKGIILEILKKIRKEHEIGENVNVKFAGTLKKKIYGSIIENNLSLFTHSLIVREDKANTKIFNRTNKNIYEKTFNHFIEINEVLGCKFVLFYIPNNHSDFKKYPMDYSERVETTFRIGFKGGIHLLFSEANPINITKFHFDGCEHHGRNIDLSRITKGSFRSYCSFDSNCHIDDNHLINRDIDSKILISFVDNIIGGWAAKLKNKKDSQNILFPLDVLHQRLIEKKIIKNINSAWYKSIFVSKLEIINKKILFPDFFENKNQMKLL